MLAFTHALPNNRVSILNPLSVEVTAVAVSVVYDIRNNYEFQSQDINALVTCFER